MIYQACSSTCYLYVFIYGILEFRIGIIGLLINSIFRTLEIFRTTY